MKKNILVTGIGQANYLLQLYENIIPKLQEFNFSILNLNQNIGSETEDRGGQIFENNYQQRPNLKDPWVFMKAIIPVLNNKYFWKDERICIGENGWNFLKKGFFLIFSHVRAYHYARFIDTQTNTDIIHLHFPKHIFALFLKYLKKDYEIIFTYWGSDIYRIDSWKDHEIQNSTLRDIDIITAATPEMEFSILSRYGFDLKPKMRKASFLHDNEYYLLADKLIHDKKWIQDYKQLLEIDQEKTIILFGHNAHWENNHIKFLKVLESLPVEVSNNYHIIFPLTYGDKTGEYIPMLKKYSQNLPSSFTFLTDFLNWEELAKIKIISDAYIHCPTTDGLSAFLTEFFYTNNLAIVGAWLPYKTFSNFNLVYLTFDDFPELQDILLNLPEHLLSFHVKEQNNKSLVEENFSIDRISNEWVKIFEELKDN